ncbi:MAG TPA: 50S ribosomal protein L28 [Patescibacteria group bacterium]|nr:50S ribosomal protein L28 [Patescibacteria group bacterium]
MSKVCDVCSKSKGTGNNVSHSNRKTRRTFSPNLQAVTVNNKGQKIRLKVCAKCLKSLGKTK